MILVSEVSSIIWVSWRGVNKQKMTYSQFSNKKTIMSAIDQVYIFDLLLDLPNYCKGLWSIDMWIKAIDMWIQTNEFDF